MKNKNEQNTIIHEKLEFIQKNKNNFKTVEEIAMITTTFLYNIIPTDKIAVAVIKGKLLKSVNVIGERIFFDLYIDRPSINSRTIKTQKTQLVNNTRNDPDYFPGSGPYGIEMLSELCVPIIFEERVLGTINLESSMFNYFTNRDASTVEAFSNEIAPAMSKLIEEGSLVEEPVEPLFGSTRTDLEMSMDVLRTIGRGVSVKTKILYAVNVSWRSGSRILKELESKGYVRVEQLSESRKAYWITELGLKELAEYDKIKPLFQ